MPVLDLFPAADSLGALIATVPDAGLGRPTPCSGYTVADLLDHIAGLTVAFGGAAVKATGESASMGPSGSGENLDPDWRSSLPARLESLAAAWAEPGAWTGMTRVGGQDLPGAVAGVIALGELIVHGWDLARATDLPFAADVEGVGPLLELAQQTFGGSDAPRGTAFGPAVPVAEDAPAFDRVLGLLGRDPEWSPA